MYMLCLVGELAEKVSNIFLCTFRNSPQINHRGNRGDKAKAILLVDKGGNLGGWNLSTNEYLSFT